MVCTVPGSRCRPSPSNSQLVPVQAGVATCLLLRRPGALLRARAALIACGCGPSADEVGGGSTRASW
jgi:hypothetical protein